MQLVLLVLLAATVLQARLEVRALRARQDLLVLILQSRGQLGQRAPRERAPRGRQVQLGLTQRSLVPLAQLGQLVLGRPEQPALLERLALLEQLVLPDRLGLERKAKAKSLRLTERGVAPQT